MLMKHKKNESINESKDEYYKYSNFMDMISPYRYKNILIIYYVHVVYIIILN